MSALTLLVDRDAEGRVQLKSPGVGLWRQAPSLGDLARSGQSLGSIEILGRAHALLIPSGVHGVVIETPPNQAGKQATLEYGQVLAVLGEAGGEAAAVGGATAQSTSEGALVFRSTSSGRFYLRPAPDKPPFVAVGDEIETGHIIYLLEVMKTFSRVAYEGEGLPARAKVVGIVPSDGDDLEAGQVVLQLEAL